MIFASVYLLLFISVIPLVVDELHQLQLDTAVGGGSPSDISRLQKLRQLAGQTTTVVA